MTRDVIQLRHAWLVLAVWYACDLIFSWTGLPWESHRTLDERLIDTSATLFFLVGLSMFRVKVTLPAGQRDNNNVP